MKKKESSVQPKEYLLYICLALSLSLPLSLSLIRISLFLLYLHIDYFDPTLGGLSCIFLGLLSHPEHTSKLLPYNLSCATTIHDHFFINAAREVIVLHLMQKG